MRDLPRRFHGSSGVVWMLIGCLGFTACGKKSPPAADQGAAQKSAGVSVEDSAPAPAPPPPNPSSPSPEQPAAPVSTAPATGAPPPAEPTSPTDLDFSAGNNLKGGELATPQVLAAYNKRLARVNYQISDFPQKLEDLNKWPMMPPLPKAPPGRRIVYDIRSRTINVE